MMMAGGAPMLTFSDGNTAATEDSEIMASTDGITDEDGLSSITNLAWAWSKNEGGSGFAAISGEITANYTPDNDDVGDVLRVCASFTDDRGGMETVCATTAAVANVSDAPVAQASTVDAIQDIDYAFDAAEFMFSDADNDSLMSITITSLPNPGTLSLNGSVLTAVPANPILLADISGLVFTPVTGASAMSSYSSFNFRVTDNGMDGGVTTSANTATMTINLGAQVQNSDRRAHHIVRRPD